MTDYIEDVSQILYDMQLTIDEVNEREDLPVISLSSPVLTFKNSKIAPYPQNIFDILEDDKKLGTAHFNQIGPSTVQVIIRVGRQQMHSPPISMYKDIDVVAHYFRNILQNFFPNHLIRL